MTAEYTSYKCSTNGFTDLCTLNILVHVSFTSIAHGMKNMQPLNKPN